MPDRPDKSINLWSIVKNCIGKDLTKIPVPVNFSEPLSFLQVRNILRSKSATSVQGDPLTQDLGWVN